MGIDSFAMNARPAKCCSRCKASCQEEFKQIVKLKISGLLIYVYNNLESDAKRKQINSIVIHNPENKEVKKFDLVVELCQYKTKCYQCQKIIQRIHNLLNDVTIIRKNEVLAVCEHCRRSSFKSKCKRCQYLLEQFILSNIKRTENRISAYRSRWYSVKNLLQTILENRTICENKLCLQTSTDSELNNLVELIKTGSPSTQPAMDTYSIPAELDKINYSASQYESKHALEEIIDKVSTENEKEEKYSMCRYIMDSKMNLPKITMEAPIVREIPRPPCPSATRTPTASVKAKMPEKKVVSRKVSPKPASDDNIILGLIKKKKVKKVRNEQEIKLPQIESLPKLARAKRKAKDLAVDSESVIECEQESVPNVMIKGTNILPYNSHYKAELKDTKKPILFRRRFNFPTPYAEVRKDLDSTKEINPSDMEDKVPKGNKGIIKYELSNREFIKKGWTKLPVIKIMRRMNIYKMLPANPQFDWFMKHRHKRFLYYDSGEILAEIYENGCGKWFYKSGLVALDYYNSEELHVKQRYIIYGCNEEFKFNTKRPTTVLACFDHLGNGIVYDYTGNIRLKYNQSEGIVIDDKIAPPSRWKWHTLNDPPVLINAYIDNKVKISKASRHLLGVDEQKPIDDEMIAIELENFVKAKANKMMQKFKPFQIRMKVVKINNYFSLRIIDQANIYILYRVGQTSLKLNIGMHLKSNEIIDTATVDVGDVSTPYDSDVPLSKSVTEIQHILSGVQQFYKTRK